MSQKAAKRMSKLISQLCVELQPAICLSRRYGAFEGDPSTHRHLTSSETNHSKSSLGNFHQYLAELLVNVYSYHLVVKSVSCCCVCGRRIFTNPVTIDPNDFNAEKVPAQRWFVPQATCSLGVCHGRQTQTGMKFSSAISYTYGLCFSFLVIQLIVFNNIIITNNP